MNLKPSEENVSSKNELNIKVGDIVLLAVTHYFGANQKYTGIISADGVISKSVSLIPKSGNSGANIRTRSCLFRIENARKVEKNDEEIDSELMVAIGKSLTYGERIQLRHWHSKGFLAVDQHNIAVEAGCLEINIHEFGNEDTWFEVVPVNKLRKAGEVIKYTDGFQLKSSFEQSAYYLHFNAIDLENSESSAEINACGKPCNWKMKKFMNFDLPLTSGLYVTTGDSFRIMHKISEGYLSVEESPIFTDLEFYESLNQEEGKVFVQKGNKTSNSLWELQRIKSFVGGIAKWTEKFRIKHLATGKFLAKYKDTLILTSNTENNEDEFELVPQTTSVNDEIRFGMVFSFRNSEELLKVDIQDEFTLIGNKGKDALNLSFVNSKKDYSLVAFVLEDVAEISTAHVYKLSLMSPKLIESYYFIKNYDINQQSLSENPEKEVLLSKTCQKIRQMFSNIRTFVIYSNSAEVDALKRQEAMRELGVIDALLKIADVIQFKIMSSSILPILNKETSKSSARSNNDENISIAFSHLNPLQFEVYQLIYEAVKNNPKNCRCLIEYEDRIMQMLSSQYFYVIGKILREMFKHVAELSKYSERRIDKWFSNLQQLKLGTSNIRNQSIYLGMIKYLFHGNGLASIAYQAQFKDKLLKPDTMKFIKLHIVGGKACVELDYNRNEERLEGIFRNNSFLAQMTLVKTEDLIDLHQDSAIFYIEDLCKDSDYSSYISSAIDFYTFICLNRYKSAIDLVKSQINASPEFIMLALNSEIDYKLKSSLIDFLTTVFIDIDPFKSSSKYKPRCFAWEDSETSKGLEVLDKSKPEIPDYMFEVGQMVDEFWNSNMKIDLLRIGGILKMVTSYLKLTQSLLDLEILKLDFLDQFMVNILYLIMSENVDNSHWCGDLISKVHEHLSSNYKHSIESRFSDMLEVVMNLLKVIIHKRENLHVEDLSKLFFRLKTMNADRSIGIQMDFNSIKELRFESIISKLEWKSDVNGSTHHLDIYLLTLLFNSNKNINREVRKKALELILADMKLRDNLKKELETVQFLVHQADKDIYAIFSLYNKQMQALVMEMKILQIEKNNSNSFQAKSKEASAQIQSMIKLFKEEVTTTYKKSLFQSILRHCRIYKPLVDIFNLDYSTCPTLIKDAANILFLFVNENPTNQGLLEPYRDIFLSMLGKIQCVTKLVAEILNRNTKLKKGNSNMLRFISESIDKNNYEFRLVQLLRTFVYDEDRNVIPKMQVDVLKWVFKNESIKYMHYQQTGHFSYLEPKFPEQSLANQNYLSALKFHCEVMKTINICAYKNVFGIMQGRKLITSTSLFKVLKKKTLNVHFKKTYLRFLYEVYMTEIDEVIKPAIEINQIEDIFREVILKDLDEAIKTINSIVDIAGKGLYESIACKKMNNLKILTIMNLIKTGKSDQAEKVNEIKLTESEIQVLDLWKYLSGKSSWHSQKDGLLYILRDIFLHCIPQNEMTDVVTEIEKKLKIISKTFEGLQKQYSSLDFSNILVIVNECRELANKRSIFDEDFEVLDQKVATLIISLRKVILDKKMSLEEMFAFFDTDKNGSISKIEFKDGIRCLLNCPLSNLDICFNYFSDSTDQLYLSQFSEKLRKYIFNKVTPYDRREHKKKTNQRQNNIPEDYLETSEINKDFLIFRNKFSEMCNDQDISHLVFKIKDKFVDPAIRKNDYTILKEFVTKLGTAFKKKVHKKYLLQILKLLVPSDLVLDEVFDAYSKEKVDKLDSIKMIQEILSKSGVIELALNIISSEHELDLVDEAVHLLINLLNYGNQKVQERFFEILKGSRNTYLFSYIRLKLRQSRDRIVDRSKVVYEKNPEKALQGKIPLDELEKVMIFQECQLDTKTNQKKTLHVIKLLRLLQLLCENCFSDFQHYIRSQDIFSLGEKSISINIVNEIAQYLINIKEVGPELINDDEATQIIPQCLETLIYLCRGPCIENQLLLGQKRKLYKFVDNLIQVKEAESKFFFSSIRFLKVLLEGDTNKEISTIMIEEINFENLANEVFLIYKEKIHDFKDFILRETFGENRNFSFFFNFHNKASVSPIDIFDWKKVECGFEIVIIFLKLRQKYPDSGKLKCLGFANQDHQFKSLTEKIEHLGGRQESLTKGIVLYFQKFFKKPDVVDMNLAYQFYLSLLASVEIDRDGYIEQTFFRVPGMFLFLSNNTRDKLLYDLNRNSHEEKVKSFYKKTEVCQVEMLHLQQLSKLSSLSWWSSKSKSLGNLSFIIIILINIIILLSISSESDTNFNVGGFPGIAFISLFGVILIILSFTVYFLYLVENAPIILYERFQKPKDTDIYRMPAANKLRGTVVIKYYAESSQFKKSSENFWIWKVIFLLTYHENLYNLIYVVLVCVAWKTVFIYPFLLLDIVRRNENLRYILKAVTQNWRQLGLTVLLGLIFVYLFGVVGFLAFEDNYCDNPEDESADCSEYYCDTLISCVGYTLYYGVRAGGGIGDNLVSVNKTSNLYNWRQVFDLLFFIIVTIILLNIIFGIIIDTFGELRDKRKKIEEDINNICIICGKEKFEFELRGSGWKEHVNIEHNLNSYLAYIVHVRRKILSQCDGLEKYVKLKIQEDDVGFLPKNAMCLIKGDLDEQNNLLKDIDLGIKEVEGVISKIEYNK